METRIRKRVRWAFLLSHVDDDLWYGYILDGSLPHDDTIKCIPLCHATALVATHNCDEPARWFRIT